jgi:hypothetical protein
MCLGAACEATGRYIQLHAMPAAPRLYDIRHPCFKIWTNFASFDTCVLAQSGGGYWTSSVPINFQMDLQCALHERRRVKHGLPVLRWPLLALQRTTFNHPICARRQGQERGCVRQHSIWEQEQRPPPLGYECYAFNASKFHYS